jgi:dienelactone hydrolase
MNLYTELDSAGALHRECYLQQLEAFIESEESKATSRRQGFFKPDYSSLTAYTASLEPYRQQFRQTLGWPLTLPRPFGPPPVRMDFVADDDLGKIYRVWVETMPGLETYALYFQPHGKGPFPLVISQHGGLGTPEICSGLFDSANYNNMSRRVHQRGAAVLAPQLLMWRDTYGPKFDRGRLSAELRSANGGSMTALELWQLQGCLDAFARRPEVDPGRVGMVGLSWGGFYTHFMAALDPRIKASICSCMFYDQPRASLTGEPWNNVAARFGFAEVTGLIAPRAFYLEGGETDDLVPVKQALPLAEATRQHYTRLGVPDNFAFKVHPGWHEFDPAEDGIDFLMRHLG